MQQQSFHWEVRLIKAENSATKKTVHEKNSYLWLGSFEENITFSGLIKSKKSWMKMYQ